jgi:hypothetical protein
MIATTIHRMIEARSACSVERGGTSGDDGEGLVDIAEL